MATVDILLATFNAGGYLQEQLDSLLAQTFADWRLHIRDDCSRDDTPDVIEQYAARHPERIVVIESPAKNRGACRNFSVLMECSEAPYLMLCDQDDVWLPKKVECSLERLRRLEAMHGSSTPLLVHTDLEVVDSELRAVATSFWSHQLIDPDPSRPLNRLFAQNFVTGSAAIFNRSLRDAALPVPEAALVQDWWLALVAAALGRIDFLAQTTILYRQHERNVIGAVRKRRGDLASATDSRGQVGTDRRGRPFLSGVRQIRDDVRSREPQVSVLLERYAERLTPSDRRAAEIFSRLSRYNFVLRRYYLLTYGFLAPGFKSNLWIWLSI